MGKSPAPFDYEAQDNLKKPTDMGESDPLKIPKVKNTSGNAWHGFPKPKK